MERYKGALTDRGAGLTLPALTGEQKQSVKDAERLFNGNLQEWFKLNGYYEEEKYVIVVRNWHRAADERGLSELQRSRFNYEMLNYILDDWMPWYKHCYDFSLLEVNRLVSSNVTRCSKGVPTYYNCLLSLQTCKWDSAEKRPLLSLPTLRVLSGLEGKECIPT